MPQDSSFESNFLPYAIFINFRVSSTSKEIFGFINTLSLATTKYKNLISLDGVSVGPDSSNFIFKIKVPVDSSLKEAENSLRCANTIFSKLFSFYPSYTEEPSEIQKNQAGQFIAKFSDSSRITTDVPIKAMSDSHLLVSA